MLVAIAQQGLEVIVTGTFIAVDSGLTMPVINWPVETYMGVAFTIGWLSNVPYWLAYVLAAVVLMLITVGFIKLVAEFMGC